MRLDLQSCSSSRTFRKGVLALPLFVVAMAHGQISQTNLFTGLGLSIPDGNLTGTQDVRTVASGIAEITSVRVRLKVTGQFNGDLYGYLRHSSGNVTNLSVLLNRSGRATNQVSDLGYDDSGFDVILDDLAANDIHTYRDVTNPPPQTPLYGTWQPDARLADPANSTNGFPRTAFLSGFNGLGADGEWTLFLADVDAHANSTNSLNSWGLEITGKGVPSITWTNPAAITYGSALGTNQLNASANVPGTFAYDPPAGTVLAAGSNQTLSVTFSPADTNAYIAATGSVALNVTAAALAVNADNLSRPYGMTNPILTATYSGFVNGEDTNVLSGVPALTTTAQTNSPLGVYPIEIAQGSLASTNYTFAFSNGTMTVTKAVTVPTLLSSTNPAQFGSSVTFTVNLTALPSGSGTPSGAVQFKVDGADYGAPVTLTNGQASRSTTTLVPGTRNIGANYPGDSNFLAVTTLLDPPQFIITPPVAAADVLPRVLNHLTRVPVSALLANDSDADGDTVVFEAVNATSAAGAALSLTNDWIFYTPTIGFIENDSFNYVVHDAHGLYATGAVSVVVLTDREIAARLTLLDLGDGTFRIISTGVPWGDYEVEFAETPLVQNWATLALGSADGWGELIVEDVPPTGTQERFYRSIYQGDGNLTLPFRISLSSSANPAPAGATVTFTVSFTPFSQGSVPPSGTVQFKVDGATYGTPVPVAGGSASLSTTNLALGEHSISAEYSGDGNYGDAVCVLTGVQVINTPPVVVSDVVYRDPIHGTKMLLSELMANDSEVDGDPLIFEAISATTAEGGSLSMAEGWIFYTPPAGFVGADSFTYTLRDSRGASATATNQIVPRVGTAPSANLTVANLGSGTYHVAFSGVPWRIYTIQYIESPGQTNWQSIATNTADSHGHFEYEDVLPPGTQSRYYRSQSQSAGATASPFRVAAWSNFVARTNGQTMDMWSERTHPPGWPGSAPGLAWNTNCLLYGLEGFTGISQCNEFEVSPGQVPVTLLTRRHGYTRGHGMGENGLRTNLAGQKVWFCTASNTVVQMTVAASFIRFEFVAGKIYDHGLVVFTEDIPESISPVFAITPADMEIFYWNTPDLPYLFFGPEQEGHCAANVAPFVYDILKGGDSGSPNMIPSPDNKLIMFSGRGTGALTPQVQADIDVLSAHEGLNPNNYQLRWYDLSPWKP